MREGVPTPIGLYLAWAEEFPQPVLFFHPDEAKGFLKENGGGSYLVFHPSGKPWHVKGKDA